MSLQRCLWLLQYLPEQQVYCKDKALLHPALHDGKAHHDAYQRHEMTEGKEQQCDRSLQCPTNRKPHSETSRLNSGDPNFEFAASATIFLSHAYSILEIFDEIGLLALALMWVL